MALPIIDSSVDLHVATINVIRIIENLKGMQALFQIKAIRDHINTSEISPIRKHDLLYTINMYCNVKDIPLT